MSSTLARVAGVLRPSHPKPVKTKQESPQTTLTTIVNPCEADLDIVAIHGLNPVNAEGHAEQTWTSGGKLWLKDFLPRYAPQMRVLLFGYNSNVTFNTSSSGIREVAENLLNLLTEAREKAPTRPLIFICHSLGGIIAKRATVHARADETYKHIRNSTYGFVFFGTPHRGSNKAGKGDVAVRIARVMSGNLGNNFMEALKIDSLFGDSMADDFRQSLFDYKILSFYESCSYRSLGLIVDKQSATLGLPGTHEKQIALNADHSHICKFDSVDDPIYQQVEINILRMVQEALKCHQSSILAEPAEAATIAKAAQTACEQQYEIGNFSSVDGNNNFTDQAGHQNESNTKGNSNETRQFGNRNVSKINGTGNRTNQYDYAEGLASKILKLLYG